MICNAGGIVSDDVLRSLIPHKNIRGFVFGVTGGRLREVPAMGPA